VIRNRRDTGARSALLAQVERMGGKPERVGRYIGGDLVDRIGPGQPGEGDTCAALAQAFDNCAPDPGPSAADQSDHALQIGHRFISFETARLDRGSGPRMRIVNHNLVCLHPISCILHPLIFVKEISWLISDRAIWRNSVDKPNNLR